MATPIHLLDDQVPLLILDEVVRSNHRRFEFIYITNPILLAKHNLKELKGNHTRLLKLLNIEKEQEPNIVGGNY